MKKFKNDKLKSLIFVFSLIYIFQTLPVKANAFNSNEDALYKYAVKLIKDGNNDDALVVFKNLLKADSSNQIYLWQTSVLYSKLGVRQTSTENQNQWFHTAEYLAKKAIVINNQSADAHLAYAMALGRLCEHASIRTQINNAKLIKSEAEYSIKLNPEMAGGYHILGRWHRTVAAFNSFERAMIKTIFGGMPGGSYDDAVMNFEKAAAIEPWNTIHLYELALSLNERNKDQDKTKAINILNKAIKIQTRNQEEIETKKNCEQLLNKLNAK